MIGYLRPFLDKLKAFQLNQWTAFFKTLAKESERPLILDAPKVGWLLFRGFNFRDFSTYRPLTRTWRQLAHYHSNFDNVRLIGRLNDESKLPLLRDKGVFLKRFSHRIGRDYLDLREASAEEFFRFMERHPVRIAKPFNRASGLGIEVFDRPYTNAELTALHRRLLERQMFVVEEFLRQHEALDRVYPHAVSTLRLTTLLTEGKPRQVHPTSIRFGSAGGRIDFAGAIIALVDRENGGGLRAPMFSFGPPLQAHPDTGVAFDSVKVPWLAEAEKLVLDCALEIPEVRYIGWDVAITPAGPVIIEGNGAPGTSDLQQLLVRDTGLGGRELLRRLV